MAAKNCGIPGFVDLQVNGYAGVDFSSDRMTEADFIDACRKLLKKGTAAFLPTVITSAPSLYRRNLPMMARVMDLPEFRGRLLGFHLEGPFISPQPGAVGVHNPRYVMSPSVQKLDELQKLADGKIRLLTVAAELPKIEVVIKRATRLGISVSLGHQLAGADEIESAAVVGTRAATHLGNGMPNEINRHVNPLWPVIANDDLTAMLITDGHHLPATLIKTIIRAKGWQRVAVVSDAAPLAGMAPGKYSTLGNDVVLERNGRLHNPAKKCLCGSSATMIECMNHLASLNLLSLRELLAVGFNNPLRLIGLSPKSVCGGGRTLRFDGRKFSMA